MRQCKWQVIKKTFLPPSLIISSTLLPFAVVTASEAINNPLDHSDVRVFNIEQFKDNYVLPLYYSQKINTREFQPIVPGEDKLSRFNVDFQISLKYQLAAGVFNKKDKIYVSYTQRSNWQAYEKSAFFRNTEYEPSLYWLLPNDPKKSQIGHASTVLGFVHESNGRGGEQERSWNRLFADFTFKHDNFTLSVKPWLRVSLDTYDYNEDISHYMGYGRISMNWAISERNIISVTVRNLVESGFSRGYERITWSFPIYKRLQGYILLESGYGITVSDYNFYDNGGGIGFSF